MPANDKTALILTVGTGRSDDLEGSLYKPLQKSIDDGNWNKIVLLPSRKTEPYAQELKQRQKSLDVEIAPLPSDDEENDVDACFAHFDAVLQALERQGLAPANICVDFTRGTKAMSAALALAAIRHDVPRMRYVEGDRDPSGQNNVIPGTERVRTVATAIATASRQLDQARAFLESGDFAAVLRSLPDPQCAAAGQWPEKLTPQLEAARAYAAFYGAWDRLNYSAAAAEADKLPEPAPNGWEKFAPSTAQLDWVRELAKDSPKKDRKPLPEGQAPAMADRARRLMVDLLANGRRRIRHEQLEDANLRAYRIAEMLGQTRLFDKGLDSSCLGSEHPAVRKLQEKLEERGGAPLSVVERAGKRCLAAAREQTFRLLKILGDRFWEKLKDIGTDVDKRNHSILIHGFDFLDIRAQELQATYNHLERLLREDLQDAAEAWLATPHFQNRFFRRSEPCAGGRP